MAADDLDAPLGTDKKTTSLKLPVTLPQIVAGVLGLSIVVVGAWTMLADDPYGGEPVAVGEVSPRADGVDHLPPHHQL